MAAQSGAETREDYNRVTAGDDKAHSFGEPDENTLRFGSQSTNLIERSTPMRKVSLIVLAAVAIYLLAAPLALSQGGNPPASTKESGATSGKGMTAVEQTSIGSKASVSQELIALENKWTEEAKKGNAD